MLIGTDAVLRLISMAGHGTGKTLGGLPRAAAGAPRSVKSYRGAEWGEALGTRQLGIRHSVGSKLAADPLLCSQVLSRA